MAAGLRGLRRRQADGESGFTLIEMLVVMVIIGVLTGIAVPTYLSYRKGAADKTAQADVRSAISAAEQYYSDNGAYPATANGAESTNLTFAGSPDQTVTVSSGNTLDFKNNTDTYVICGKNTSGGTIYVYNSASGKPVGKSTQASLANCISNGN